MSRFIDLRHAILNKTSATYLDIRAVLEWLDENPDQRPGRTILESGLIKSVGNPMCNRFAAGFFSGFKYAGGIIVSDRRHPDAAKLESILDRVSGLDGEETGELANKLCANGVRVVRE